MSARLMLVAAMVCAVAIGAPIAGQAPAKKRLLFLTHAQQILTSRLLSANATL